MRWFLVGLAAPLIVGFSTYWLVNLERQPYAASLPLEPLAAAQLPEESIAEREEVSTPVGDAIEFVVRRNDTLERIFRETSLSLNDLAAIRLLPGVREALDSLRPGDRIAMTHIDGALQTLVRRLTETSLLSITRGPEGFAAEVVPTPIEYRETYAHGEIDTSLFNSAREAGLSSDLILRMANEVFGWDIDFALDIRRGDSFRLLYERKFRDGEYLGDGRILAAEFTNEGHSFRAVRFESEDGRIDDFFTPEGKSMRKQFLRAPVDFKYISSNFNPHRLHPILNITRPHQGVDYAAPTGTPIKASGDGRVSFAGVKGGYGKAVILEHGGNISTLYGHMSRFAASTRVGARVKQGDIIGYVGSTGMATASHLHYEYRVNGVHKNPRTIALPDANPIPTEYSTAFATASTQVLTRLSTAEAAQLALIPTP